MIAFSTDNMSSSWATAVQEKIKASKIADSFKLRTIN
jgi:hypothetical protein